jgi:serine/threonine protein kinase
MPFRPSAGDSFQINNITYTVASHPQSPMYPYAQEGGRATVYRIDSMYGARAIKVFKSAYRTQQIALASRNLERFSTLAGMGVCRREVLSPTAAGEYPLDEPDLAWSVVMPWIEGSTWYDVITEPDAQKRQIDIVVMRTIVEQFLNILIQLELNGVTHCDLSPGNLLIRLKPPEIDLIDVEEICANGMNIPENIPRGTPGYMHKSASNGMWHPYADRFAGAVLLCEMVCWSSNEFQAAMNGDSYFAPNEMQESCDRYHLMRQTLIHFGGLELAEIFDRCWFSADLASAPAFWEWARALQGYFRKVMPSQPPSADILRSQLGHTISEMKQMLKVSPKHLTNDAKSGLQQSLQWLEKEHMRLTKHVSQPSKETQRVPPDVVRQPAPKSKVSVLIIGVAASLAISGYVAFGVLAQEEPQVPLDPDVVITILPNNETLTPTYTLIPSATLVPTETVPPTFTNTAVPIPTDTRVRVIVPPTNPPPPTDTPVPPPTDTPVPPPTDTPVPPPTDTPVPPPTDTPVPKPKPKPKPTDTAPGVGGG